MQVMIFGATGMVGQGVLRECLSDNAIDRVLAVGRNHTSQNHSKLTELIVSDFNQLPEYPEQLTGFDACFFCLGVSAFGMSEAEYHRITHDLTMTIVEPLLKFNPNLTFIFLSGTGADNPKQMWARVKRITEQTLLQLPFKSVHIFRPAFIQPLYGIKSRTLLYRFMYAVLGPLYPVWKMLFPDYVTTTEKVGRAMIHVAKSGEGRLIHENRDINRLSEN